MLILQLWFRRHWVGSLPQLSKWRTLSCVDGMKGVVDDGLVNILDTLRSINYLEQTKDDNIKCDEFSLI